MSRINKPTAPLVPPTTDEDVEVIVAEAIAADDTHASLVNGEVPSAQLPSYVDDVLEFADAEHFPAEGEVGKIYVAQDTNLTYRWSGAAYIQVGGASLGAGDGIEIENDIVSVDEDYLNGHLEFEAPIEDLATIRSGAAAGATAVQPAALNSYYTSSEVNAALANKANNFIYNVDFNSLTPTNVFTGVMSNEDYEQLMLDPEHALIVVYVATNVIYYGLSMVCRQRIGDDVWMPVYSLVNPQGQTISWAVAPDKTWIGQIVEPADYVTETELAAYHDNSKQDVINDLSTIRSGAAAGATAVQPAAVANDIEIVEYQDQTPITEAQLAKAVAGKLAIHCNGRLYAKYYQSEAIINFHAFDIGHNISSSVTVTSTMQSKEWVILLNRGTRMLSNSGYMPVSAIGDYADNFLEGSDEVAEEGKKLIREKDLYPVKGLAESALQPADVDALSDAELERIWNPPVKGDIVRFDAFGNGTQKRFRVVKAEGVVATLLALDIYTMSTYNTYNKTTQFDNGSSYAEYENGPLDILLNETYYNSLSTEVKQAIVATNRTQSCYDRTNLVSTIDPNATINIENIGVSSSLKYQPNTRITQKNIGNRYCFALDIDDVVEYFGLAQGGLVTGEEVNTLFFGTTSSYQQPWMSTARMPDQFGRPSAVRMYGGHGSFGTNSLNDSLGTQPAFRIDLSQVNYTKEAQ